MNTCLICLQGLSGSGKTTVANFLSSTLNIPVYHSDVERKKLFGLSPTANSSLANLDIYTKEATKRTFHKLYELALEALSAQQSVLLDAAFLRHHERLRMQQLARDTGALFLIVKCQAGQQIMIDRIRTRQRLGNDPSEASEDLIHKQKQWQEALTADELQTCIKVFTEEKNWQETLLQHIYRYIS